MYTLIIHGQERKYPVHTTFLEIAKEYQGEYKEDILLVLLDFQLKELRQEVKSSGTLTFLTGRDKSGKRTYRRSLTLLMQRAVHNLAKEDGVQNKVYVRYSISNAYYCEFSNQSLMTESYMERLKKEMESLAERKLPIKKDAIHTDDAVKLFHDLGMTDKERLFYYRRNSRVNVYSIGKYVDYYYGYMVPDTGYLKYFDLRLFEDGFVLMYPDKDPNGVAEFQPSLKLFQIFKESSRWGETLGISYVGALNDAVSQGRAQDIILVQEALMEQRIGQIAENVAAQPEKKFIMMAGPSSSGKTTFSHRLSIQLMAQGLKPHPISLDNYYVDRVNTPKDEYGNYDFEALEALDVDFLNQNMVDLLNGKMVDMPVFNFQSGKREYRGHYKRLEEHDILVLEGIHGLNDKLTSSLPKSSKLKIYISALTQLDIDEHNSLSTTDGRLIRRLIRDARTRNISAKETIAMWESVRRGEDSHIFPFQEEADIMFNSALIYEIAVLKQYVEPLLFQIEKGSKEFLEAKRLLKFLDYFLPIPSETIQKNSILREFIGGGCFNL